MKSGIAVIGIGCLFPGAKTPQEFWRNLIEGRDSRTEVTDHEIGMPVRACYDPEKGVPDKFYCPYGGYVRDFEMDASGFRIPEEVVLGLDNVFQWSLHVAREALRDAGYLGKEEALERCGVILGNLSMPTRSSNHLILPIHHKAVESCLRELLGDEAFHLAPFAPPSAVSDDNWRTSGYPAAVVARALSLGGQRFSLDAACASSLYSVRLACDYLVSHRADIMLAGAVSAPDPLFVHTGFSIFQAYPEEGSSSSPLDRHSGGLIAAEGAGMFVLKRLSDALREGDRIYATILGAGLSNDGRGQSVLSPNPKGQAFAFERAYAHARVDPRDIDFVECHATGTPLGDRIELDSMDAFFGKHMASPLVGAVKSNVGHLLTTAGMASMTKVILAMVHGLIPPTIHVRDPQNSANQVISDARIPRRSLPWPDGKPVRLAAASAFGLGGTNAHIIFERGQEESSDADRQRRKPVTPDNHGDHRKPSPMAIVGMDASFGPCEGLAAFHQSIYEGRQRFVPLPSQRWKGIESEPTLLRQYGLEDARPPEGAYAGSVDLDFLRFKIPPNEDDRLIPQHLLLLKVADRALHETGIQQGENVAVIVAMETEFSLHEMRGRINLATQLERSFSEGAPGLTDAQRRELVEIAKNSIHGAGTVNRMTSFIGNIMASRVSSAWDFSGPAFTVSSEENSVFKALELAQMMLENDEVEAVVVGAVDLSGGVESVLLRNRQCRLNTGPRTLSFDRNVEGWTVGEGAGAVVLRRHEMARDRSERIYATIDAIGFSSGTDSKSVEQACGRAFAEAGVDPGSIGYLEVFGSGVPEEDEAEMVGLARAYGGAGQEQGCAMGSAKATVGHTFAASGMASLIKAALCLHHRFIPGILGWTGPKRASLLEEDVFYVPVESKTWFLEQGRPKRRAAVSGLGHDGVSAHLILSEETSRPNLRSEYLVEALPLLIPVCGSDCRSLQQELDEIKKELLKGDSPATVADACFERYGRDAEAGYGVGIVGLGADDFIREIEAVHAGLEKAFEDDKEWSSPRGSYFTARPLGRKGKIAFVYPGGLSSYIGLGQDLFQLFPEMLEHSSRYSSRLGEMVADRLLYPRGIEALSGKDLDDREKVLIENPIAMFESGIMFSIVFTKIVTEVFRLRPDMAFGYSMGEVSMMFALGVWDEADSMSRTLRDSPLFRTRLAGPMQTVREAWNLPAGEQSHETVWHCHALRVSAARAREALKREPRAYLIFVNSPDEVVIAGEEEACERVLETLRCEHHRVAMSDAIHCPIARSEYDELVRVHTLPVRQVSDTTFYSSDRFAPLPLDQETIAKNIAEVYCHEIDFPKLVQQTYTDGARIFVEVGPRENCTYWIGEILKDKPHLAVGTNRKGVDDKTSIVRALARLFSHRVALDLAPLYSRPPTSASPGKSLVKSTTLGGTHIPSVILDEKHRGRFKCTASPRVSEAFKDPLSEAAPPSPIGRAREEEARLPCDVEPAASVEREEIRQIRELPVSDPTTSAFEGFYRNLSKVSASHAAFLKTRQEGLRQIGEMIQLQFRLAAQEGFGAAYACSTARPRPSRSAERISEPRLASVSDTPSQQWPETPTWEALRQVLRQSAVPTLSIVAPARRDDSSEMVWDYADLREFAEGNIAKVFGKEFSIIDTYRRRVRLPMEPYLLVTRVTKLDAQTGVFRPCSMTTEYDVPYDAWYSLDGQVPWAVAVEAGQCDLLLISYLGIDFECRGERVYRLLDCTMTFLGEIAQEGETLRYDIKINSFARTGGTLLFFFEYDCYVKDKRVLEMRGGCAGFFTDEELEAGKGIILTEQEIEERSRITQKRFEPPLTCEKSSFVRQDLLALARDDKAACFGPSYDPAGRNPSLHFSAEAMLMLDRVVSVDPRGGPWGLGVIVAEKDLAPDHWYFPCHFKDDPVLAGSLMAEGCGQLLRFYMLYLGLQTCTMNARFQPVPNRPQKVRCRGQVIPKHSLLTYRMEIKEIGTTPRPYAIADVDIIVDGKVVVDFKDLGVLLAEKDAETPRQRTLFTAERSGEREPGSGNMLFTKDHLREFATGSLAKCFGQAFTVYENRKPPRLPGGDLQLIDRVVEVSGKPLEAKGRAHVTTECDIPEDAWYLRDNSHPAFIPNAILMELSLQPCLFVSAYAGTPLLMRHADLCFRALEGEGTLLRQADLAGKTVTCRSSLLSTVAAGNSIIQRFEFVLAHDRLPFFQGSAVCGYFSPLSLANSVGLGKGPDESPLWTKSYLSDASLVRIQLQSEWGRKRFFRGRPGKPYYRLACSRLDLLDEVRIAERGGRFGRGYVYGSKRIDPLAWFFPLHFHEDPVMPGSLGIEALLQAMQVFVLQQDLGARFDSPRFTHPLHLPTAWKLRGQILPQDERMTVEVHIKKTDRTGDKVTVVGDGSVWRDDIRIYELQDAAICLEEALRKRRSPKRRSRTSLQSKSA